jgi:putative flippase GtrA
MRQVVSFLGIGGVTMLLYFALICLVMDLLKLPYPLGVSIAYCLAISFHFLANRRVTFRAGNTDPLAQATRYLAVAAINYLLTLAVVATLVELLHLGVYTGAAFATILTTGFGFVASKYWVFRGEAATHG